MKLHVWPTPEAEAHIAEIGEWWRENRQAAPTLFRDELERTVATLAESPFVGTPYKRCGIPGVRSHRLGSTPYRIYYVPRVDEGEVIVLAVWSSMRKHGPPLTASAR